MIKMVLCELRKYVVLGCSAFVCGYWSMELGVPATNHGVAVTLVAVSAAVAIIALISIVGDGHYD